MTIIATIISLILGLLGLLSVFGIILFPILTIIFGIIEGTKQLPAGQKRSFKKTIICAIGFGISIVIPIVVLMLYGIANLVVRS